MWKVPGSPLRNLLVAYLNQDWQDEYPDVWTAVESFKAEAGSETREGARAELRQILDRNSTESQFESALDAYGCAYYPPADGYTYSAWLVQLEERLRTPAGSGPKS